MRQPKRRQFDDILRQLFGLELRIHVDGHISSTSQPRISLQHSSLTMHVAAVALTPLTTHVPQTQAELVSSPVRGQEQEQPGVVPS